MTEAEWMKHDAEYAHDPKALRDYARDLRETVATLQGLVAANAEHAAQLLAEKATLLARIRELEARPPTYEDWRRAAYNEAIDRTSADLKAHVEGLDATVAQQRERLDREYRRNIIAEEWLDIRRHYWMRLALANRARAGRLDKLYQRWRARAEAAERKVSDRWGSFSSENVVLREQVLSERNNALEEAKQALLNAENPCNDSECSCLEVGGVVLHRADAAILVESLKGRGVKP